MKTKTAKNPAPLSHKPKLHASSLYLGDNGRCFCGALRCAGSSAHFTGRDISGQRVEKLDAATAVQYGLRCESCAVAVAS